MLWLFQLYLSFFVCYKKISAEITWSEFFLSFAGVEGCSRLLDVGQQLHPLPDVFAKLVAQAVRLKYF
jgi:hypothetical protein